MKETRRTGFKLIKLGPGMYAAMAREKITLAKRVEYKFQLKVPSSAPVINSAAALHYNLDMIKLERVDFRKYEVRLRVSGAEETVVLRNKTYFLLLSRVLEESDTDSSPSQPSDGSESDVADSPCRDMADLDAQMDAL